MAIFDFSGVLPTFKATIASSPLAARFNDIKTYLATTFNPAGISLPSADGSANQALVADGDTTTSWSHVVRSNVALNHDDGNGTVGQILQSDGDGTTSWLSFSGLSDGDKGDIVVSGTGSVWTVDTGVIGNTKLASNAVTTTKITDNNVTLAKVETIAANTLLGNSTGSTANVSTITIPPTTGQIYPLNGQLHLKGTRTQAMYFSNNTYTGGNLNEIINTTTETSIFKGKSVIIEEPGETTWPTLLANMIATGDTYRIKGIGLITTTGSPTVRFKLKIGSVDIIDTTAIAVPTAGLIGSVEIEAVISFDISSGLATTQVMGNGGFKFTHSSRSVFGIETSVAGPGTVDMTANRILDCTFQWGTASASNRLFLTSVIVERVI